MLNPRGSRAISYHFPKAYWSKSDVRLWLEMHNATSRHLYTTTNEIRAPQMPEGAYREAKFKRYGKMSRWSGTFGKPFFILIAGFSKPERNPDICNVCARDPGVVTVKCIRCKLMFEMCYNCYCSVEKLTKEENVSFYMCYECVQGQ